MTTGWQPVMSLDEVPEGKMRACSLGGRDVVVCHTRDGLLALDDVCTHAMARLSEGRLRGNRLICPLHGASFDARTGSVLGPPAVRALACHEARINEGRVEVRLAESVGAAGIS